MSKPQWLVVYTSPRSEKAVASRLAKAGIEYYCPLKRERKRWSDRWKWIETPLFSSYVFVSVSESQRESVLRIPGIRCFVFWLGKPAVIRDEEMIQLQTFLGDVELEHVQIENFSPEDKVRIHSGPLQGLEGVVNSIDGSKLEFVLENLGCVLRVDKRYTLIQRV